ncbi:MAG: hypothetical protein CMQ53_03580 [Gammaproteobacteria bacterium]|nr:hypothetical protein [Gammaproteobacteria bacterium]
MIKGAKYYIFSSFFKYILINIFIFIGLIWLSQILRILELQNSISNQIFDVVKTTSLILPSFINPLMPYLLLLGSFFLNYKINTNNEIIILKQYLAIKEISNLILFLLLGIILLYFLNNEYFSIKTYHKYKIEELEIRNNLKLGVPSENEFHIENELSIFFDKQEDNVFYDIEALIYQEGQFIKSNSVEIEISKKDFNLVFLYGERLLLNLDEKSKTNFDKFTYSIKNRDVEELLMDKEHFNTFDLLNHTNKEFVNHGHNRIYQYILNIFMIFSVFKIIFFYVPKSNLYNKFLKIFLLILSLQIINSYSLYLLNNEIFNIFYYYLINCFLLISFIFTLNRIIK